MDETQRRICNIETGILRPANPTACDIPARPGAEPCKRRDIMDNKSRRKIVSLLGPLSSLPHAACWNREPSDHEARSSCKYIGSLASRGPRFILLRWWGEGAAQVHRPGNFGKCFAITSSFWENECSRSPCGLSHPPKKGRSPEAVAVVTSSHVPRPRGLVGHKTGVPWRMKTSLIGIIVSKSELPAVFVTGILLLNERWYFMMIMVIRIAVAAALWSSCLHPVLVVLGCWHSACMSSTQSS